MTKTRNPRLALVARVAAFACLLSACGVRHLTQVSVNSYELQSPSLKPAEAYKKISQILVDRGYDIKLSNTDAGIVTSEFKKFASTGDEPPFDYLLQIRASVKEKSGGTAIQLTPAVKSVNRLNAAAQAEDQLTWLEGEPGFIQNVNAMRPKEGWQWLGQTAFMNIVADVASAMGLRVEDAKKDEVRTPKSMIAVGPDEIGNTFNSLSGGSSSGK